MVLYVASDLLWATRIRSAAEDLGIPSRPVRNPAMLAERLADSPVRAMIVDLEAPGAVDLIRAARGAGGSPPGDPPAPGRIRIIAFGPHVATELLEQARAAGADEVLARGAFDRRMAQILTDAATHQA